MNTHWAYGATITTGQKFVVNGTLTLQGGSLNGGSIDVYGTIDQQAGWKGGTTVITQK